LKREDFPLLINNPKLVYLDNACTSLKPLKVIQAESRYYTDFGACAGRSSHRLGRKTNEELDKCRETVARFVGAHADGLIWTKNATEALNLIAKSFGFSKKRKVVTTIMEHHAVLLPFMKLRDNGEIELEILQCDNNGEVPIEKWESAIDDKTALVVTNSGNNTTGYRQNIKKIGKIAHDNGALICVDGAQGVPHHKTNFKNEGIDFLCFSAHKMLGPTGIGAVVTRKELLADMEHFIIGGGTVKTVRLDGIEHVENHTRFEAGIQDYAGIFGFAEACGYLEKIGMEKIEDHEKKLRTHMVKALEDANAIRYGKDDENYSALCSFNFKNAKPHDVALMLDKHEIAVRSGFFCAQPAIETLGAKEGAVRASCYIYNTEEDIKKFGDVLQKLKALYA